MGVCHLFSLQLSYNICSYQVGASDTNATVAATLAKARVLSCSLMHYDHPGSEEWKNVQGEVLLSRLGLFKESPWCMMPADDMLLYAICDTTGSVLVLWSYLVLQAVLIVLDHVTGDYMDVPGLYSHIGLC